MVFLESTYREEILTEKNRMLVLIVQNGAENSIVVYLTSSCFFLLDYTTIVGL